MHAAAIAYCNRSRRIPQSRTVAAAETLFLTRWLSDDWKIKEKCVSCSYYMYLGWSEKVLSWDTPPFAHDDEAIM